MDSLAAAITRRRNSNIRAVHLRDAERVDCAKGAQSMPVEFDPMSSGRLRQRISKSDLLASLIERDEIVR